jgi:hypothetical protein
MPDATSVARDDAQDRLLEATPDLTAVAAGGEVPASLGALLDLHGMDPGLDSRRYTSNTAEARQARFIRRCHAGLACVLPAAIALVLGAGLVQLAAATVVGAIAAVAIARSHRTAPGAQPLREILVGFAIAAAVSAAVALQPAIAGPVSGFFLIPAAGLAAVVAIGAATLSVAAAITHHPLLARATTPAAAVLIVLAI